jgi:small subunit ribosomal protein S14
MTNLKTRDNVRRQSFQKYEILRLFLKSLLRDARVPKHIRFQSVLRLNKLPRRSSKVRITNRCIVTGRGRGNLSQWKLSRITFRELASQGLLAGVRKASW